MAQIRRKPLVKDVAENYVHNVIRLMLDSRLMVILVVQMIANALIPDHQADAFYSVPVNPEHFSLLDRILDFLIGGFGRWDSIHFLHIAQYGYTFENSLAFGPAYPMLIRFVTLLWHKLIPLGWLHIRNALLISGFLINLSCFVIAGVILYKLTLVIFKDNKIAFLSALLFSLNPASIFFSSCYSESLFSMLSWLGLYCLYSGYHPLEASICFALAMLTRSNGLLNCGFIAFALFAAFLHDIKYGRFASFVRFVSLAIITAVISLIPYCYHLYGIYRMFCMVGGAMVPVEIQRLAQTNKYILPGDLKELTWCNSSLPLFYSHIQYKYWDVGLFRYYKLHKIPCFILASPALVLCWAAVVWALKTESNRQKTLWTVKSLLPFAIHSAFIGVFSLFFINVEVVTRILFSSSPLMYWFAAHVLLKPMKSSPISELTVDDGLMKVLGCLCRNTNNTLGRAIILYWLSYAIFGTCIHANFLPWT